MMSAPTGLVYLAPTNLSVINAPMKPARYEYAVMSAYILAAVVSARPSPPDATAVETNTRIRERPK